MAIVAVEAIEPWERQHRETAKAFAAFRVFRELPPEERSLGRVAVVFGQSINNMERWAQMWGWHGRAAAFDRENDRIRRAAQVKAIEEMARRQAMTGVLMQSKGTKRIEKVTDDDIEELSVWEAVRLIEAGSRLERIARGEPPDGSSAPMQVMLAGEAPTLIAVLRDNPERIGPVVQALAALREALPPEVMAQLRNVTPADEG